MLALDKELTLRDKDFHKIRQLVYQHSGISLSEDKFELVQARLAKLLRKTKFNSIEDYLKEVIEDKTGTELFLLVESITTNFTSFFREKQHFEFLNNHLLPVLIQKKQSQGSRKIRAWSAGCSSGEEPYSIAITLLETINQSQTWDIKVLATDISKRVLEVSKAGRYAEEKVVSIPKAVIQKYLKLNRTSAEKEYHVSDTLRNTVIFKHLNLMDNWPITISLDFIFCRNVMIYFDKKTQQILVDKFWNVLASGGMLFTGHSESLTGIRHKFDYVQPTIYLKP
ncbi:MAG: protein-glutamate O-methyltransferase [Phycisphaerales bacterium]|jgi:chemotaxis protein methyltransferase CheR